MTVTLKTHSKIGMLGTLTNGNPYSLYLLTGKDEWDYTYIERSKWDAFFNGKDVSVTEDRMKSYLKKMFVEEMVSQI